MNESNILKHSDSIIFRKIEGMYVLLPMSASAGDVEYIYNLNEIGSSIWEKIDGTKPFEDILSELMNEYAGNHITIRKETVEFINDMKESKLIQVL
jgi:hypothetical protein